MRAAYGMETDANALAFLRDLNAEVARREANDQPVTGPGLPAFVDDRAAFVTEDCITPP